jgi:mono/diheme cytochrome c family protein
MRTPPTAALTAALGLCAALAVVQTSPAAPAKPVKKPAQKPAAPPTAAQIAQGKQISEQNGCNGCHAADYAGKKGFSPSIRAAGVTKQYTLATFERVMDTGVTEDGDHVRRPMPVYHMPAAKSAPLYAFLKTLK